MGLTDQDVAKISECLKGIISSSVGGCRDHIGFVQRITTIETDYKHLSGAVKEISSKQDETNSKVDKTNSKVDKINESIQKMFYNMKSEELDDIKDLTKDQIIEIKDHKKEAVRKKELHVGWLITLILGIFKFCEWLPGIWAWIMINIKGTP